MNIESYRPKISKNLKNLFLDPNNYRFVDNDEHKFVPEKDILDQVIQKRTRNFIEGIRQENIKDLILSFKANGFLDVDVIQVKDLGGNNYLVLEGNRRVTALKFLQESYEKGNDIGKLDPAIFKSIPFEIHNNQDVEKHLIIMGLKHISGNKKWSTFNQSKLLYDFLKPYEAKGRDEYLNKEDELVNSLGISKTRLRSMLRVYNLILAYKQSEFGEQFDPNMFGIFEEIIKKPVLKLWLEWNDNGYYARNEFNLNRLFSWISKTEEYVEVEEGYSDDEYSDDEKGEFKEFEPIITKSLEIRDLAMFINNERAIKVMEEERSLARGLVSSGSVNQQSYKNALTKLDESLKDLDMYRSLIVTEDVKSLESAKEKLLELMPKQSTLNVESGNFTTNFEYGVRQHFKSIFIKKYKIFKDFELSGFNRINIFAGMNNTGKTSLLESIYLLTQRNDISSHFNLIKNKNKFSSLSPSLLNAVFQDNIMISGFFNDSDVNIEMIKFDDSSIDKQDDYIASYKLSSEVDGESLSNLVHTFTHERMRRNSSQVSHLCSAAFKSPYFYDIDDLIRDYNKSLSSNLISLKKEDKENVKSAISLVVDFLNSIEPSIKDVRFTEDMDLKRFIVESSNDSERNFDLTSYGEGIQRIFYIALSFAACKNGVLFIDEFETAIHYTLLLDFTRLTQKLAQRFNVQLFLTSHSNECIRAFMENGSENETITGFQLIRNKDKIDVKRAVGERFGYLIKNINLDIRG